MALPHTNWKSLRWRNPDRRWWQFWKPRYVLDAREIMGLFLRHNDILDDLVYTTTKKET